MGHGGHGTRRSANAALSEGVAGVAALVSMVCLCRQGRADTAGAPHGNLPYDSLQTAGMVRCVRQASAPVERTRTHSPGSVPSRYEGRSFLSRSPSGRKRSRSGPADRSEAVQMLPVCLISGLYMPIQPQHKLKQQARTVCNHATQEYAP